MANRQPSLFLSYSRIDRRITEDIVKFLRESYDHVWFDERIYGGQDWWNEILTQISQADIFVYLMSRESIESEYCIAEYQEAVRLQKLILPVLVRARTVIPQSLSKVQYIDLSHGITAESANKLQAALIRLERQVSAVPRPPLTPVPQEVPLVTSAELQPQTYRTNRTLNRNVLVVVAIAFLVVIIGLVVGNVIRQGTTPQVAVQSTPTIPDKTFVTATATNTRQPTTTGIPATLTPIATSSFTATNIPTEPTATQVITATSAITASAIPTITAQVESVSTLGPLFTGNGRGKILFNNKFTSGISTFDLTTGKIEPFMADIIDGADLAFSPDGTKLAFAMSKNSLTKIYIMSPLGSKPDNSVSSGAGRVGVMKWSPDSTKLAFNTTRGSSWDLYLLDFGSNSAQPSESRLTKGANVRYFDWSPDGTKIALSSAFADAKSIVGVLDVASQSIDDYTSPADRSIEPVWTKDGKFIFYAVQNNNPGLYMVEYGKPVTGRRVHQGNQVVNLELSPDGKRLAFVSDNFEMYVINSDGTGLKRATNVDLTYTAKWSPDSKLIATYADPNGSGIPANSLCVLNPDDPSSFTLLKASTQEEQKQVLGWIASP
jgi:Tol biopolymer transport system component